MLARLFSILLCVVASASLADVSAQIPHNYHFSHLKSADGLPHQQIEDLAFDAIGRLWIATRNGLACYDGYTFNTFYHEPSDSTSIPYNFITRLLVDSNDNLWVGTEYGICRYCPESNSFRRYNEVQGRVGRIVQLRNGEVISCGVRVNRYDPKSDRFVEIPLRNNRYVLGAAVSPDNRLFISTDLEISVIEGDNHRQTILDPDLYADFLNGSDCIAPLFFDSRGHLWVGRNGKGVMDVDFASGQRRIYSAPQITDGTVRVIAEDSRGLIWLGTEVGLNAIDPLSGDVQGIRQDLVNHNHLNDNAIYCISPDAKGNLWIGTYFGGINILRNDYSHFLWFQPGYDGRSLRGKAIRRLIEPLPGRLWMASEDGGINIMNLSSGTVDAFSAIPAIGNNVHELFLDESAGDLWIGTFRNGLFRYNMGSGTVRHYSAENSDSSRGSLPSDAVFCIARQPLSDGACRLWVGTTQGLRIYDPSSDSFLFSEYPVLDHDFIYTLASDSRGNMWVGTVNNGLFRIDTATGDLLSWGYSDGDGNISLNDHYITTLFEDNRGRMFVGTNTGGLHYIDVDSLRLHSFSQGARRYGTVCMITADSSGTLWVSTSSGLFSIDPDNLKVRQFTVADGLPENQFNFASGIQASDGRLYFGTVNGLVAFAPDVIKISESPRPVHLWHLKVNNREILPGDSHSVLGSSPLDELDVLNLDYDMSRSFSIDYGVVSPASAASALYQVCLEGVDRDWRDVGSLRQFNAMELAPGSYRLRLRSSNDPDRWDDAPVRELLIRIAPPWYLSIWAFIVYLFIIAAIIYLAVRLEKARMREKESMKLAKIEKQKSDELNREKMEFFTIISHELKTPLSLILAPLKYLIHHESLSSNANKRLGVAIANTNKMVGLIDELVTFNRVEAGNFQLYLQKGNPLTIIENLTGYFREAAAEKKISLNVFTENNGEEVWFSTTYLERIVNNLLSNAVKYTQEGGAIDVRASIVEEPDNRIFLLLEVRDNGIGIAPEETENIFRKYYQTKRGYNTDHSGWGIGLATVKKLVDAHKGSIGVRSVMGEGSTFAVKLNVVADAFDPACVINGSAAKTPEQSYLRLSPSVAGKREIKGTRSPERVSILIVEDNPELLRFLSEDFSANYNVFTATNGLEALRITAEHPIDIVVSDVMMPEMDGLTLCSRLKNDLATSHIPVILLTAKNDDQSVMSGFECGAEAYVAKPFDPKLLELRVRNILRARRRFLSAVINPEAPDAEAPAPDEVTPQFNKFDKDFMVRINAMIDANMDNSQFSIADITREFGISRSLLHIKMKSFANCSMTDYIRRKRMERACVILRQGFNVSETAYRTGYSDPNYFSKVFKKEIGLTPTEFVNDQPS